MSRGPLAGKLSEQNGHMPGRTADSRIVAREEFVTLLTSRRRLFRADSKDVGLRGLVEPATGQRFLIEERRLFPARALV